jgi:hypothetical protein
MTTKASPSASPSPAALRMRLHRDRRRKGLRCVTIELRKTEIEALVRGGLLQHDRRHDRVSVRDAVHQLLDRTFGG